MLNYKKYISLVVTVILVPLAKSAVSKMITQKKIPSNHDPYTKEKDMDPSCADRAYQERP